MLRYFSADFVFPVSGAPIKDGIIALNHEGEIAGVYPSEITGSIAEPIEKYKGIIVPGFVNSHCHLELSHMLGKIPKDQGLIAFIKAVISERNAEDDLLLKTMEENDRLMFANGIIAVADISNHRLSKDIKQKSKIYYHTFIELLGFDPAKAEKVFNQALELKAEFSPLSASIVPHAPYSVSERLFGLLREYSEKHDNLCSIHNQECKAENDFFMNKSGGFLDFYKWINQNLDIFKPRFKSSIQSVLPLFSSNQKTLLVHNTYTGSEDVKYVSASEKDIYWCFCPKANQYIEGKLPYIDQFLSDELKITVGTDSLASNDKLCVLSELKTIKEYFPELPFSQTLRWATLNGAKFLGIENRFGSIEKGKTPGLNLIENVNGDDLTKNSTVKKLI